jgi:acetyl-CoA acetyltransferase
VNGHPFRDRAAVVGVGATPYSKNSGVSTLTMALHAISAAVEDAGLTLADIDGVACHRVNDSAPASIVAESIGQQDVHFFLDQFGGGSTSHAIIGAAANAIVAGQAECIVCWRSVNARSEFRMGGTGRPPPDQLEFQYQAPFGYAHPPQQFAMIAREYMVNYGATSEDFGAVAVAQRKYAELNERALMRTPLTMDDYLASRWIVEPLRLFDCCLETDAAVAVVLTSVERARDLRRTPVTISGAMWGSGHTMWSNRRPDLAVSGSAAASPRLWAQAGVGPPEVDVAEIYDAFTPLVLIQMEDYGFCAKGEAGALVRSGATGIGGSLPVNTHGGHLSEGYVHGLNHLAEAVHQLRRECGARQVEGAEVALSTGQGGYVMGNCSAVVLKRGG